MINRVIINFHNTISKTIGFFLWKNPFVNSSKATPAELSFRNEVIGFLLQVFVAELLQTANNVL